MENFSKSNFRLSLSLLWISLAVIAVGTAFPSTDFKTFGATYDVKEESIHLDRSKRAITGDDFKSSFRSLSPVLYGHSDSEFSSKDDTKVDPTYREKKPQNFNFKATDIQRTTTNIGGTELTKSITAQVSHDPKKGTGKSATAKLSDDEKRKQGYIPGLDRKGHMLAARLGGTGHKDYIFPQNNRVNNGEWKKKEGQIADNIKKYGPATVRTTLIRKDTNPRPVGIICDVTRSSGNGCGSFQAKNPPYMLPKSGSKPSSSSTSRLGRRSRG